MLIDVSRVLRFSDGAIKWELKNGIDTPNVRVKGFTALNLKIGISTERFTKNRNLKFIYKPEIRSYSKLLLFDSDLYISYLSIIVLICAF